MNASNLREQKIDTLNELIAVTRDSADFYDDAAEQAHNPQLKALFQRMAEAKSGLVDAIAREVEVEGVEAADEGTFRGSLHRMYGNVRGKLGSDDYGYVAELEEAEDRMLHAFRDVLEDKDAPLSVKEVVRNHLPTVKQQHDLMRDRKWAMDSTRH
jgi:uncharacterized protein (TIGR02284 family)